VVALQAEVDALYRAYFDGLVVPAEEGEGDDAEQLPEWTAEELTEAAFAELGRTQTALMSRLLKVAAGDSAAWTVFQSRAQELVLKRNRTKGSVEVGRCFDEHTHMHRWADETLPAAYRWYWRLNRDGGECVRIRTDVAEGTDGGQGS
jgi:hypothetical protein